MSFLGKGGMDCDKIGFSKQCLNIHIFRSRLLLKRFLLENIVRQDLHVKTTAPSADSLSDAAGSDYAQCLFKHFQALGPFLAAGFD